MDRPLNERSNTVSDKGYTLAEMIPALLVFTIAGSALLAGFSGLFRLNDRSEKDQGSGDQETLTDAFITLTGIVSDLGSDPWETYPETETETSPSGFPALTFRFVREGHSCILRCRREKDSLVMETGSLTQRVILPSGVFLKPWRDRDGRVRGILLCRDDETGNGLFIPFGRQSP